MCYENITYYNEDVYPSKKDVFKAMGIPVGAQVKAETEDIYERAYELFTELIQPRGIYRIIAESDFINVYHGEGKNDPVTPLTSIYPEADRMALYVFTLGKEISDKISKLIDEKEFPLGFMLDRIASESADKASASAEALTRLRAGESELAIHAGCGTNFATTALLAGTLAWFPLSGQKSMRRRFWLLPFAVAFGILGYLLSQPMGPWLQAKVTTETDLGDMQIEGIIPIRKRGVAVHRVITRN